MVAVTRTLAREVRIAAGGKYLEGRLALEDPEHAGSDEDVA